MKKEGSFIESLGVWELPDDSKIATVLNEISRSVDRFGIFAINWINKNEVLDPKVISEHKPEITKISVDKEFAEEHLLLFESIDRSDLNAPHVEMLSEFTSYSDAEDFALKHLKEINYSKKIYIAHCKPGAYIVWVRK